MTDALQRERWQQLTARTVDDCHPHWLMGVDAQLFDAARQAPRTRRLVARRLAQEAAPAVFSLTAMDVLATLPNCDWILADGGVLRSRVADLGVLALAPGLRKLVGRAAVRELRVSLGSRRYEWLLSGGLDIDARISDVWQLQGWRLVDRYVTNRSHFRQLIEHRGLHEICGALSGAPALLQQRVRSLFAPSARDGGAQPWLPPGCALRLLRDGGSDDVALDDMPQATAVAAKAM